MCITIEMLSSRTYSLPVNQYLNAVKVEPTFDICKSRLLH